VVQRDGLHHVGRHRWQQGGSARQSWRSWPTNAMWVSSKGVEHAERAWIVSRLTVLAGSGRLITEICTLGVAGPMAVSLKLRCWDVVSLKLAGDARCVTAGPAAPRRARCPAEAGRAEIRVKLARVGHVSWLAVPVHDGISWHTSLIPAESPKWWRVAPRVHSDASLGVKT
jgi:hypothetical protein